MPKTLSHNIPFFIIISALCLSACGQKGALYLGKVGKDQTDTPIFAEYSVATIVPNYLQLQTLTVGGSLAQIKQNHLPSWQALLTPSAARTNLIRYVVFDGDVLSDDAPITVLSGTVQNPNRRAPAVRQLSAGSYLRFRSLETGVNHLPRLLAAASRYLNQNNDFVRDAGRADFLTENEQNIDLYFAVEKR